MDETQQLINEILDSRNRISSGFKLISLQLEENPVLGNLFLKFCDDLNNLEDYPFNTVVIGPNGTGKSNILKTVINLFREIHELKQNDKRINKVPGKFVLTYLLNGKQFSFGNFKLDSEHMAARFSKGVWFTVDNQIEDDYNKILLPNNIIANSLMITDKFPFLKEEDFPRYTYLGVRSSRASSGTKAYIRKTVELITTSIEKKGFKAKLKEILSFLDLEPTVNIYYKPVYSREFYKEDIDVDEFHRIFNHQKEYFPKRETEIWGTTYYDSIKENNELVSSIVDFLQHVAKNFLKDNSKLLHYDVLSDANIVDDFKMIEQLKKLDLISYPSIDIRKQNSEFNLVDSSSGEYSLLSSLIGLVASVEENSLVLIDEPEVSLHPNWQMKYMDYLRKMFEGYKTCHFIVATHSHFLISDIQGMNSHVIGLVKNRDIEPVHFSDVNTFGWSAEQVLLDVFDVPTTRNFYLADRFAKIMKKASLNGLKSIEDNKDELLSWEESLSEGDPIKYAITKLIEKAEWRD
ncbi:MAG: hypothetical protein COA32_05805 [Fluviicola sp.]|nr:MAG: hypothetical protein COA32_05805 [Fluviicola sp.]